MEKIRVNQTAIDLKMKYIKVGLLLLSIVFTITSFFMISGGTTLKILFGDHYHILEYGSWYTTMPASLSSLYISTGCLLLTASVFGIVAVLRESTCMTNFYGVFLSLIFILQLAAAITGFMLSAQASYIWSDVLDNLMSKYLYSESSTSTLDWIQRSFRCCGNWAPERWVHFAGFGRLDNYNSETAFYYHFTVPDKSLPRLPQSCCEYEYEWDSKYKICKSFFTVGCNEPLSAVLTESVMMIAVLALVIGLLQIIAIVCAFIYGKMIRGKKTNRDLQRWTMISQNMGLDRPAYADKNPAAETLTEA